VILKFKMRRWALRASERGERTGIKRRNGGYNQRETEGPHKQKQKMKRKNFKKGEK
jgi:hypothetical protein